MDIRHLKLVLQTDFHAAHVLNGCSVGTGLIVSDVEPFPILQVPVHFRVTSEMSCSLHRCTRFLYVIVLEVLCSEH